MFFEMLTGVVPFDDPSAMSLALKHLTQPPPSPRTINANLNIQTESVILKGLHKEPAQRYTTATAMVQALEDALKAGSDTEADLLAAPALPAGIKPKMPALSQMSLVEMILQHEDATETTTTPQILPPPPPAVLHATPVVETAVPPSPTPITETTNQMPPSPSKAVLWGAIGFIAVLLLLGGLWAFTGETAVDPTAPPQSLIADITQEPTPEEEPTATEEVLMVDEVETATAVPVSPTDPPPPTISPTDIPTTNAPASPTPVPSGRRVRLLFNESSFYIFNTQSERIRASNLEFESLDEAGEPVDYYFSGNEWAQFYSFIEERGCMRLEVNPAPTSYLRPSRCQRYNSTVTPSNADARIFWVARDSVTQFRVLWSGTEIGRCPLTESPCTVYIP